MRLTLAVALLLAVVPAKPERQVGPYGAVFCEDLESLRLWMSAMLERQSTAVVRPDYCEFLKPETRIGVDHVAVDLGGGSHVIAVRVHGNGGDVDGYTLDTNVVPVPPWGASAWTGIASSAPPPDPRRRQVLGRVDRRPRHAREQDGEAVEAERVGAGGAGRSLQVNGYEARRSLPR